MIAYFFLCHFLNLPIHQIKKQNSLIGNLPTPIHGLGSSERFQQYPLLRILHEVNITLDIKRDDMTGGPELGGNKVRKLEFLLADALGKGCDSVVTIGGEQSNHCRATACAARLVGLHPHLILRRSHSTTKSQHQGYSSSSSSYSTNNATDEQHILDDESLGLQGNILFDRIVGSTIHTCTPGEVRELLQMTVFVMAEFLFERICSIHLLIYVLECICIMCTLCKVW
jgi:1-aminocyclopropane-1-carboxylate deaminase/D-cysteine desulfhydrase-like pyridoxal-dependent ACC family enzyme